MKKRDLTMDNQEKQFSLSIVCNFDGFEQQGHYRIFSYLAVGLELLLV